MKNNGIYDPVNHKLTAAELNSANYSEFMDVLTDVPESIPLKPITVDKAGVTSQRVYLTVDNILGSGVATLLCDIEMLVELKGHRGIHMSRCIEALFELSGKPHKSLDAFTEQLARELIKRQSAEKAYVSAVATYLAPRETRVTRKNSYDSMYLSSKTVISSKDTNTVIGIEAYNMTGCPCTETYTKFTIVPKLIEKGFDRSQIQSIIDLTISGTHTQRGIVKLYIDKVSGSTNYRNLYEVINSSCHLTYELLKRPDEHELVVRALKKPQFTEDVVRDVAAELINMDGSLPDHTNIKVVSTLFDSIHIHDVHTEIDTTLGSIRTELNER